jgi:hypothetical protein
MMLKEIQDGVQYLVFLIPNILILGKELLLKLIQLPILLMKLLLLMFLRKYRQSILLNLKENSQ